MANMTTRCRRILRAAMTAILTPVTGIGSVHATPQEVARLIEQIAGNRVLHTGRIEFDTPRIAEDGNNVLVGLDAESPMTETDYVKTVYLLAEGNPNPVVAVFHFSPMSGRASLVTRIRLAKSQRLVGIAAMSDGALFRTETWIDVTIGGCGTTN